MWVRGVRVTSMEKQLRDLSILMDYQNRQVILNYYQDGDMLYKRDGFHFASVQLEEAFLVFTKRDKSKNIISLKEYPNYFINTDFQNYYTFQNGDNRLEIYFP